MSKYVVLTTYFFISSCTTWTTSTTETTGCRCKTSRNAPVPEVRKMQTRSRHCSVPDSWGLQPHALWNPRAGRPLCPAPVYLFTLDSRPLHLLSLLGRPAFSLFLQRPKLVLSELDPDSQSLLHYSLCLEQVCTDVSSFRTALPD